MMIKDIIARLRAAERVTAPPQEPEASSRARAADEEPEASSRARADDEDGGQAAAAAAGQSLRERELQAWGGLSARALRSQCLARGLDISDCFAKADFVAYDIP